MTSIKHKTPITTEHFATSGYTKFLNETKKLHFVRIEAIDEMNKKIKKDPNRNYTLPKLPLKPWAWELVCECVEYLVEDVDVEIAYSDESDVGLSRSEPHVESVSYPNSATEEGIADAILEDVLKEIPLTLDDDNPVDDAMYWAIWDEVGSQLTYKIEHA